MFNNFCNIKINSKLAYVKHLLNEENIQCIIDKYLYADMLINDQFSIFLLNFTATDQFDPLSENDQLLNEFLNRIDIDIFSSLKTLKRILILNLKQYKPNNNKVISKTLNLIERVSIFETEGKLQFNENQTEDLNSSTGYLYNKKKLIHLIENLNLLCLDKDILFLIAHNDKDFVLYIKHLIQTKGKNVNESKQLILKNKDHSSQIYFNFLGKFCLFDKNEKNDLLSKHKSLVDLVRNLDETSNSLNIKSEKLNDFQDILDFDFVNMTEDSIK